MPKYGGLYDGFEGYESVSDMHRIDATREALVVLDTNVLLGLYNFQGRMLEDFTKVFEALGDRLFVPHQVMDEFWRNRRTVLSENQGRHREQATIEKAFSDIDSSFRKWHQRVVDRNQPPNEILRELSEGRQAILDYMSERNLAAGATTPDTPTDQDRVLKHLERILQGRVGPAPTDQELEVLRAAGRQRIADKRPPGYMDSEKNPERAVGDYIVWRQTMDEAASRQLQVMFVTQDMKEDWWADRGTESRRARPELVAELLAETGQHLIMVRSTDLVAMGRYVGVEVSEATLEEADKAAEAEETMDSDDDSGWSEFDVEIYLDALGEGWPAHAQVLREAVENGGRITRERMANILGKDPDASMKGSGRPYGTALRQLGWDDTLPFYAHYEDGGLMSHFVLDDWLLPLFTKVIGEQANSGI